MFKVNKKLKFIPTLLALILFSFSSAAHHSAAPFDTGKQIVIKGEVTKFQWTNPHVWIHINVADSNGEMVEWKVEYVNPNALKRQGWKRKSFQVGDKVSITVNPVKSGEPKGWFVYAVLADGSTLGKKNQG